LHFSDNAGTIIIWSLTNGALLQKIDVSFAGFITVICWITLHSDTDGAAAFVVGSGNGMISYFKKDQDKVHLPLSSILLY